MSNENKIRRYIYLVIGVILLCLSAMIFQSWIIDKDSILRIPLTIASLIGFAIFLIVYANK